MAAGAAWQCWPSLPQSVLLAQTSPVQGLGSGALSSTKSKIRFRRARRGRREKAGAKAGKEEKEQTVFACPPKHLHSAWLSLVRTLDDPLGLRHPLGTYAEVLSLRRPMRAPESADNAGSRARCRTGVVPRACAAQNALRVKCSERAPEIRLCAQKSVRTLPAEFVCGCCRNVRANVRRFASMRHSCCRVALRRGHHPLRHSCSEGFARCRPWRRQRLKQ